MFTLYHYWSSVCSQKVRMCLAEKKAPWHAGYSLADIAMAPIVNRIEILARPAYAEAFSFANPDTSDPVTR